jgi:hypothetical protein
LRYKYNNIKKNIIYIYEILLPDHHVLF